MEDLFKGRGYHEWKGRQMAKAQTDDNFIDSEPDSAQNLQIVLKDKLLRTIRARIEYNSNQGYFVFDRAGRRWAVDTADDYGVTIDDTFILKLRDHVVNIMSGIGWMRD